ncbi:MAG: RNA-binding S4 domain-containing protein [Clostridiales bacterium]|nr:RNA-binding S4 domain-containing protein [Clostridiales bacterium]
MEKVYFVDEYVTLNQFLKIAGIAYTGGEGKEMIQEGLVFVNGEQELRRGKKIRKGDEITISGSDIVYVAENE